MELFLSANIHQGNDLFSVYSRGGQCAFMCLWALLTARNNPVVVWSKTTLNNVLLQGDSMYLEALNNGFISNSILYSDPIGDKKPTEAKTIIDPKGHSIYYPHPPPPPMDELWSKFYPVGIGFQSSWNRW